MCTTTTTTTTTTIEVGMCLTAYAHFAQLVHQFLQGCHKSNESTVSINGGSYSIGSSSGTS